ncbi:MAG: sensor histidine kinase [Thermodesulfobacteriota bacterium]
MNLNIRAKLTLLYTLLLGTGLIIFGIFLYTTLSKSLLDTADSRIRTIAEIISKTALRPSSALGLPKDFSNILERFFGIKTSGKFIQILDNSGRIILKSASLGNADLPFSKEALHNAIQRKMTFETIHSRGRYPIRIITYPVMERGKTINFVQIGTSLETIQDTLNTLLYLLYASASISLIFAGIVGWLLANRALRPVAEITKTARRIGAENLNQRLEVRNPGDEIGRLAETFNDMISRLESSFDRIKQFTADVSHEIKTPITILKGETEIALKTEKTVEGFKSVLVSNLEEINRMTHVIEGLLFLSRRDSGIKDITTEEIDMDDLLKEKYQQAILLAKNKEIKVILVRNDPVRVKGNPIRLRQLLLNLIENAVKYTPKTGEITLSLEKSAGFARIVVSDTGIGVAREDLPYLFDRFFRVDKARSREEGGSGLGLSICKGIVNSHNGSIEVKSRPGKGSKFIIHLPAIG